MGQQELLNNYRPNVGIVLFNRDGRVWYGRRAGDFSSFNDERSQYRWQMPQGGVDAGEDIETAALRELKEETGVTSARLLLLTPGWLAYDFPAGYQKKNWKGQRQKWAAMMFEGEDQEIDLEADDHQEFEDWRWGEWKKRRHLSFRLNARSTTKVSAFLPLRDFLRGAGDSCWPRDGSRLHLRPCLEGFALNFPPLVPSLIVPFKYAQDLRRTGFRARGTVYDCQLRDFSARAGAIVAEPRDGRRLHLGRAERLAMGWSPEQIAGRLARDDGTGHESIYRFMRKYAQQTT